MSVVTQAERLTNVDFVQGTDNFILVILGYLLLTLPLTAVHFSVPLTVGNHILLVVAGILAALSSGCKSRWEITVSRRHLLLFVLLFASTLASVQTYSNFVILKNVFNLFATFAIINWAREVRSDRLVRFALFVMCFYVFDAVLQYVFGADIFGHSPLQAGRYWGAFYYGAPSFGVALMAFFFAPLYYLRNKPLQIAMLLCFILGMALADDRAPFVQLLLAYFFFSPGSLKKRLYFFLAFMAFVLLCYYLNVLPNRISTIITALVLPLKNIQTLFTGGSILTTHKYIWQVGFNGYLSIWPKTIETYLHHNTLLAQVFGTGWGGTPYLLHKTMGIWRTHNIYLDVLTSLGAVGLIITLGILVNLFRKFPKKFMLLAAVVLPFSFYSLFSANWLYLILFNILTFMWAPDNYAE